MDEVATLQGYSEKYGGIYHTVGVHPSDENISTLREGELISLSSHDKCVGIGETGLDYHYNDSTTFLEQKKAFRKHILASVQVNKPLIIHTRAAKNDTLSILREDNAQNAFGVIHCFTEDWAMAKQCLDLGFYISFSGIVTFKNALEIKEVAKKIPLDRLLVETDSPYLTPMPYRGKPNYPAYVKYVVDYIAKLRGVPFDDLAIATSDNAKRLFVGICD